MPPVYKALYYAVSFLTSFQASASIPTQVSPQEYAVEAALDEITASQKNVNELKEAREEAERTIHKGEQALAELRKEISLSWDLLYKFRLVDVLEDMASEILIIPTTFRQTSVFYAKTVDFLRSKLKQARALRDESFVKRRVVMASGAHCLNPHRCDEHDLRYDEHDLQKDTSLYLMARSQWPWPRAFAKRPAFVDRFKKLADQVIFWDEYFSHLAHKFRRNALLLQYDLQKARRLEREETERLDIASLQINAMLEEGPRKIIDPIEHSSLDASTQCAHLAQSIRETCDYDKYRSHNLVTRDVCYTVDFRTVTSALESVRDLNEQIRGALVAALKEQVDEVRNRWIPETVKGIEERLLELTHEGPNTGALAQRLEKVKIDVRRMMTVSGPRPVARAPRTLGSNARLWDDIWARYVVSVPGELSSSFAAVMKVAVEVLELRVELWKMWVPGEEKEWGSRV